MSSGDGRRILVLFQHDAIVDGSTLFHASVTNRIASRMLRLGTGIPISAFASYASI